MMKSVLVEERINNTGPHTFLVFYRETESSVVPFVVDDPFVVLKVFKALEIDGKFEKGSRLYETAIIKQVWSTALNLISKKHNNCTAH